MAIQFSNKIPGAPGKKPVIISGVDSVGYANKEYLIRSAGDAETAVYEIRYQFHCSPFKEALLIENLLAVGHEEHFYLFNVLTNQNILQLKLNGYFAHLCVNEEDLYVADASGLWCIHKNGEIGWCNSTLAIDGVIVNGFTGNIITGSGELNSPGGWEDFRLEKSTGKRII